MGLAVNFTQTIQPLRSATLRLLLFSCMVVAGVLLLMGTALAMAQRHQKAYRELQLLRDKTAEMEKLNQQAQELAHYQRLETIGTLTSSIAHEFNNLLTPIMGYSMMTIENLPPDSEELYDNVLEIYNASRKAKTIIARLGDLSRKHTTLNFRYLSLDDLVRSTLEVAAPAQPARVDVVTELGCRDAWLYGDENQLSQMLLNLIVNAFHAMEQGGGVLTVSTCVQENQLILTVRDTGPGISPEALPRLFEPFFTTKEAGHGIGLGLAIVHQVVEAHQGSISVDSNPGEGTVFTVVFSVAVKE